MGLKEITEVVKSEYVFATLFVLGLIFVGRWVSQTLKNQADENRNFESEVKEIYERQLEKSYQREERLMEHQTNITGQLSDISSTQTRMQASLDKLEQKTEENFRQLWREVRK